MATPLGSSFHRSFKLLIPVLRKIFVKGESLLSERPNAVHASAWFALFESPPLSLQTFEGVSSGLFGDLSSFMIGGPKIKASRMLALSSAFTADYERRFAGEQATVLGVARLQSVSTNLIFAGILYLLYQKRELKWWNSVSDPHNGYFVHMAYNTNNIKEPQYYVLCFDVP